MCPSPMVRAAEKPPLDHRTKQSQKRGEKVKKFEHSCPKTREQRSTFSTQFLRELILLGYVCF